MSPRANWNNPSPTEDAIKKEMEMKEEKVQAVVQQETHPMTIMTESDAYIAERMKGQPQNLSEIEVTTKEEKLGVHRLSLPDYFEEFSYDCTTSIACQKHGWKTEEVHYGLGDEKVMLRYIQTKRGKYIFKWLSKKKQALDRSVNVHGWYLVNRSFFPEAPKILFSVNGGVEEGDAILGFMYAEKALGIRSKPAKESQERTKSETTKHKGNPNFYEAKLDPESVSEEESISGGGVVIEHDGTIIRR